MLAVRVLDEPLVPMMLVNLWVLRAAESGAPPNVCVDGTARNWTELDGTASVRSSAMARLSRLRERRLLGIGVGAEGDDLDAVNVSIRDVDELELLGQQEFCCAVQGGGPS